MKTKKLLEVYTNTLDLDDPENEETIRFSRHAVIAVDAEEAINKAKKNFIDGEFAVEVSLLGIVEIE